MDPEHCFLLCWGFHKAQDTSGRLSIFLKPDLAEAVAEGAGHLGGGVGGSMRDILEQSAQVPLAHQPRESLRHVVEEAQRVPQEVRRAQDEHRLRERDAIFKGTVS
jgi:hypothetical protein